MHITNLHDAKATLSQLIRRALAGEEVIIAKSGEPMVRLVPVRPELAPRVGGQLKGRIRIADDFDDFGPDLERLFYGDET